MQHCQQQEAKDANSGQTGAVETIEASWRQSERWTLAALRCCQEEEEEEEAMAQEYSSRLFLARGQLWPWAEAQRKRRNSHLTYIFYTHTHSQGVGLSQ